MLNKSAATLSLLFFMTGFAHAAYTPEEQMNKDNVLKFYEYAINNKDFKAAKPYLGKEYKQHNPIAEDGVEGFRRYVALLKSQYPDSHSEIKRVLVDGDYVVLHVKATGREADSGKAIIDIFRLDKDHKIVEHWDVTQPIPAKTTSGNSMF